MLTLGCRGVGVSVRFQAEFVFMAFGKCVNG